MKKFLLFVAFLIGLSSPSFAQTNLQTTQLQARWTGVTVADGKKCVKPGSYPITSNNFVFTVRKDAGAVSAILVTVYGSTDGTDPPVTSLGTSSNTAGDTIAPAAAPYTNLCIALTSITGAGNPVVDFTYSGSAVGSGGSITGSVSVTSVAGNVASTVADGANVTLGAKADAKSASTDTTPITQMQVDKQISASVQAIAAAVNPISTSCSITSTISTNSTSCKGSAGNRLGGWVINTTATLYYLRFYNTAAAPTCSSATGFIISMPIPASTTGAGIVYAIPSGAAFATGYGYCITASSTSTANDNAAAGIFGELYYN